MNSLEQLREQTLVVADTGDFELLDSMKPTDATTNPSHILKVASDPRFRHLVDDAVDFGRSNGDSEKSKIDHACDKLLINFGSEILKKIPGRVSTEVDARLSFDKQATIDKALTIIDLYEKNGIDRKRITSMKK